MNAQDNVCTNAYCTTCASERVLAWSCADVVDDCGRIVGAVCEACSAKPMRTGYHVQQRLIADVPGGEIKQPTPVVPDGAPITATSYRGYVRGAGDCVAVISQVIKRKAMESTSTEVKLVLSSLLLEFEAGMKEKLDEYSAIWKETKKKKRFPAK